MYVLTAIDLDITIHVRYVLQENQRDLARGVGTCGWSEKDDTYNAGRNRVLTTRWKPTQALCETMITIVPTG